MILALCTISLAVAGPRDAGPVPDDPPPFGADVAVGYGAGSLLGSWPDPGLHGFLSARYDAFVTSAETAGPRLGASLWGSTTLWPVQHATEPAAEGSVEVHDFDIRQYGVTVALRPDPEAPVGFSGGFGFSRLELDDYYGGPQVLPAATFEAGVRQRLPGESLHPFLDWQVRAHWATSRSPTAVGVLHEWWMVQFLLSPGLHLR